MGLAALAVLVAVGYFGLRVYLNSNSVKELASAKLTEKLGSEVRVTEMSSDMSSTTLQVEIPGDASEAPLVKGSIRVDVSPLGLAAGSDPKLISVDNATVHLRFDRGGNILGKLPKPPGGGSAAFPAIEVRGATVHIAQEGKPDFHIAGVDLRIAEKDSKLVLEGTIDDPEFAAWKVRGEWAAGGSTGSVTLVTLGPVHVTPEKLKSIPFVPKETWESVELDGTTTASVTVGRNAESKWTWRVECKPMGTRLKILPIDLELTETSGTVLVDGAKVTLSNVVGKTADGTVQSLGDSVLDFGPKPSRLEFNLKATDLDAKKTPASWGLSKLVNEGRVHGGGKFVLLIGDGELRTEGKWRTVVKGKALGGTVEIRLFPNFDSKGLRFQDDGGQTANWPRDAALLMATLIQASPVIPKKEPETQYVRANLKLVDVDIAELVAKANLASPVKLAGKATLDIAAEIPVNKADSIKYYRATGALRSPSLQIENLTLTDVAAEVQLKDGVLKLTKFAAEFPKGTREKAGSFTGTATFGLEPRTELVADLQLDEIPLGQVFAAFPGLKDKADGIVSGAFHLKIPGDKLTDVKSYEADGKLASIGITVFGQKADKLSIQIALKNGIAELTKAEAEAYGGTISGEAKLPLVGNESGSFKLNFKTIDSALLIRGIPDSPVKLAGKFDGKLTGTLPSLEGFEASKITADLDLASAKLVVQGIPTTKLTGKLGYKPGAITYALKGYALGGSFDVDGTYPLGMADPKKPIEKLGGTIRIQQLRLDRLARELRIESLEPLRGVVTLALDYTHGPDGPAGGGRIEIRDFAWGDARFDTTDLVSEIQVSGDGFEIPAITGELAGGLLRGRVRYDFDEPRKSLLTLKLENADATALLAPLGLKADGGRISISLRSSIGKSFRGSGTVTAARAKIEGVDVSDVRIPVTWVFIPGGGAQFTVRDAKATVANGSVSAKSEVVWNGSARVEGLIEFVDANVGDLAKGFGTKAYGIGKTTGRFDFRGNDVRTASDLQGTLTARLGRTTVREIPILGSLTNVFSPVQALTRFDSGELTARLGSGLFRIERLTLAGTGAKLFADGTVSLGGKLDLDVVYNTGQIGPSAPLIRTFLRDIPAIGPIPVGLIVRITEGLSNRIVRVHIDGTTDRPTTRVNPTALLSENAVRFFVGQYVPLANPSK